MVSLSSYLWWISQTAISVTGEPIHFGEFAVAHSEICSFFNYSQKTEDFLSYKLYLMCTIVENYILCIALGIVVIGIFLPHLRSIQ